MESMRKSFSLAQKCIFYISQNNLRSKEVFMGSPLGPVLAEIRMTELEQTLLPQMDKFTSHWMRYVDDTIAAICSAHTEL